MGLLSYFFWLGMMALLSLICLCMSVYDATRQFVFRPSVPLAWLSLSVGFGCISAGFREYGANLGGADRILTCRYGKPMVRIWDAVRDGRSNWFYFRFSKKSADAKNELVLKCYTKTARFSDRIGTLSYPFFSGANPRRYHYGGCCDSGRTLGSGIFCGRHGRSRDLCCAAYGGRRGSCAIV